MERTGFVTSFSCKLQMTRRCKTSNGPKFSTFSRMGPDPRLMHGVVIRQCRVVEFRRDDQVSCPRLTTQNRWQAVKDRPVRARAMNCRSALLSRRLQVVAKTRHHVRQDALCLLIHLKSFVPKHSLERRTISRSRHPEERPEKGLWKRLLHEKDSFELRKVLLLGS